VTGKNSTARCCCDWFRSERCLLKSLDSGLVGDSDGEERAESVGAHSRVRHPSSRGPGAARGAPQRYLHPRRPR
jgi:hypothetical protein